LHKLNSISNSPRQKITFPLEDNSKVVFNFEYKANQIGWFFSFTYNDNTYSNLRVTTSYNLLRYFRTWLPFGLRVDTVDRQEPTDLDDFSNGYATLYILNKSDIETTEANYYVKTSA